MAKISYGKLGLKLSTSFLMILLSFSALTVLTFATPVASAASNPTFTNYELARSGDSTHSGVNCPNTSGNCWNWNGEPNIATAPDGTVYVSSENTAFNHPSECGGIVSQLLYICGGTGAWKSTDGGKHFTSLTSPNTNYNAGTPVTFWGGDTHVATATAKNEKGFYNVYVVSLEAAGSGLVGVGESTSRDGGATWSPFTNPNSAPGVQDRPWVAGYGANEVCLESHTGAVVPGVFCSFDGGLTFTQSSTAFDAAHSWLTAETSIPGAIHIDPHSGVFFLPFSGLASESEAANAVEVACGSTTGIACPYGLHAVYMAVSTNGGLTFTDHLVYANPSPQVNYGSNFLASAADRAGNLYEVYSDGVSLFYSFSTDQGQTWRGPYGVNKAPSNWAIEPWVVAGDPGKIDIVWYGSPNCGTGITDADNCGPSATWSVYMAQNLNVFTAPSSFTQVAVTGTIHMGPVCLNGSSCQSYRGLFDDFGITADPRTGMANIAYDNDMWTPSDPSNLPNPDCTSQYTTSSDPAQQNCVHTVIAHQTSGPGIFRKHSFQIRSLSLTQTDLNHASYGNTIQNDGDASITSLSVSLASVSIPLSWNSTLPLQSGGTILGNSIVSPQSLLLVLGSAYPAAITATYEDGTTDTITTSVSYSLT